MGSVALGLSSERSTSSTRNDGHGTPFDKNETSTNPTLVENIEPREISASEKYVSFHCHEILTLICAGP